VLAIRATAGRRPEVERYRPGALVRAPSPQPAPIGKHGIIVPVVGGPGGEGLLKHDGRSPRKRPGGAPRTARQAALTHGDGGRRGRRYGPRYPPT